MLKMAKTTSELFHLYRLMPENYQKALLHIINDEMQVSDEEVRNFRDQIAPQGPVDFYQAQAEYAYQVLHRPLPPIISLPNVPPSTNS